MLAALQVGLGQALQGQFHRVHRIAAAGQHGPLQQGVEGFCQGHAGLPELASRPGEQVLHRHAVLGEGAGLVDRQHGGATQALDCRGGAGQHADARQAQGPQGQKQGQHHRDFVGQHRQGQGQGGQQGAGPIATETPLQHRQAGAQPQGPNRQAARKSPRVALQPGERRFNAGQAAAQPPQLGSALHPRHRGPTATTGHQ